MDQFDHARTFLNCGVWSWSSRVVRLAELFRLGLATAVVSVERRGGDNLEGWLQRLEHHGVRCETVTESARAHCCYSS